jgi:uncharacterized membrane protein YbhN (UPF0104 family)
MAMAPRRRVRSIVIRAAFIVGLLAVVAFVIAGVVPGSRKRLAHPAAGWIALEVVLELGSLLSYTWLFHGVFSREPHTLSVRRSAQIGVGELGAFAVVPTGAGGPVLRVWALLAGRMPFRLIVIRSIVHGPILNIPYIAAAVVLGFGVLLGIGPGHAPTLVALAPIGVVIVTIALFVAAARYVRRPQARPVGRWQAYWTEGVAAIPDGVRSLTTRVREPKLLLAATGYWAGDCGVLVVAFHSAHGSASVGVVVLAYMLGQLGNLLPLPGGVGGVEPVMLGVLTASGVNLGLGGAAIVLYRFVSLGLQAAMGTLAVVTLIPTLQRRRGREQPSALGGAPGRSD